MELNRSNHAIFGPLVVFFALLLLVSMGWASHINLNESATRVVSYKLKPLDKYPANSVFVLKDEQGRVCTSLAFPTVSNNDAKAMAFQQVMLEIIKDEATTFFCGLSEPKADAQKTLEESRAEIEKNSDLGLPATESMSISLKNLVNLTNALSMNRPYRAILQTEVNGKMNKAHIRRIDIIELHKSLLLEVDGKPARSSRYIEVIDMLGNTCRSLIFDHLVRDEEDLKAIFAEMAEFAEAPNLFVCTTSAADSDVGPILSDIKQNQ